MEFLAMRKFAFTFVILVTLSLSLSLPLSTVAQNTGSPQTVSDPPEVSSAPLNPVLADGTPVRLRMGRTVSSTDARTGDPVSLEVLDEVRVDDTVIVPKGSAGLAIVTVAEPRKLMGRGGKLDISVDSVKLVNGRKAALRAVKQSSGNGNQSSIVAAMAASNMSTAPLIFLRGKDITIPQGTEFVAYVNGDVPLDLASLQPATLEAKVAATTFANSATELYFSSFPGSAEIQIDGKFVGTTPSDVVVRAGEHKVDVRLSGFKIWRRTVVASGTKQAFKIRLLQDGQNGSTVSNCSGPDCMDIPLGDIAKQKRDIERNVPPE
jgi:hypothetical protein